MSRAVLLKSRRFLPLFLTQFLGAFNDNFFKNALVILVTYRASTVMGLPPAQIVVLSGGIFILPFFLFSATAGQMADKYEKSTIIRWVKLAEICIMLLAVLGFMTSQFGYLLGVLFLMGLHSTFFGPLKYSILPQHLSDSEIVAGNAMVEAGTFVAILIGTIAGGVLIAIEPDGPLIVSICVVAVAIVGYLTSRFIPKAAPVDPTLSVEWNPIRPTIDMVRYTRQSSSVFLSIMGISWFWFFGAAMLSLFPSYCKDFLGADEHVVTLLLANFSIGIAVGSLLCEVMSRKRLELGLVPLGSIGMSLFGFDLFLVGAPSFVGQGTVTIVTMFTTLAGLRILFALFGLSVFSGFFTVPLYTLIQTRSEPSHRSRTIAANNIINAFFMVVASGALMGFLAAEMTIPQIFGVLAVMNAAVALYIYSVLPEFLLRFVMWLIASVMYRMQVKGHDHIPHRGPAILVCNHVSFVDWLVIAAGVKRPVRFVMDHSFYKGFIGKALMRHAKVIPIAPAKENPALLEAAFARVAEELRAGALVCIFPEGRITKDGELDFFRPGIERIIRETPVPVVPMALVNLWGSFFSREGGKAIKKVPKRFWSSIELVVGAPIPAENVTANGLHASVKNLLGG